MTLMLPMMAAYGRVDRRKTPRMPLGNLVAQLDLRNGQDRTTVCVWDLSASGACLMVPPVLQLPQAFDLYVDGRAHPVQKIWHHWAYVGVILHRPVLRSMPKVA